jgi:hypothetical protein
MRLYLHSYKCMQRSHMRRVLQKKICLKDLTNIDDRSIKNCIERIL